MDAMWQADMDGSPSEYKVPLEKGCLVRDGTTSEAMPNIMGQGGVSNQVKIDNLREGRLKILG